MSRRRDLLAGFGVAIGYVLEMSGRLIPGAVLDFWQTDDLAQYDNDGHRYRAQQFADVQGLPAFGPVWPLYIALWHGLVFLGAALVCSVSPATVFGDAAYLPMAGMAVSLLAAALFALR